MIPRYSRPEMVRLWTPEHRYQTWLAVELAAARAMADAALVPRDAVEECARKAGTITAQDAAQRFELGGWPMREIRQGAGFDCTILAIAFAQEDGWR